jgi:hypothetical protein
MNPVPTSWLKYAEGKNVNRPCETEVKKARPELSSAQIIMYIPEKYLMPHE